MIGLDFFLAPYKQDYFCIINFFFLSLCVELGFKLQKMFFVTKGILGEKNLRVPFVACDFLLFYHSPM